MCVRVLVWRVCVRVVLRCVEFRCGCVVDSTSAFVNPFAAFRGACALRSFPFAEPGIPFAELLRTVHQATRCSKSAFHGPVREHDLSLSRPCDAMPHVFLSPQHLYELLSSGFCTLLNCRLGMASERVPSSRLNANPHGCPKTTHKKYTSTAFGLCQRECMGYYLQRPIPVEPYLFHSSSAVSANCNDDLLD